MSNILIDMEKLKAKLRIPTAEQYAYLEVEVEGTHSEILEHYEKFNQLVKVGMGLDQKEWNECLDRYLSGKGMDVEHHEKMNKAQVWLIHEIDKSEGRRKPKQKAVRTA